jgi:hypothetical protein
MRSRFPAFLLALLFLPSVSAAFCGLQSCPRVEPRAEAATFDAGLRTRWVAFDIGGREGSYVVTAPRAFARYAGFALGTEVPFTRLDDGGEVAFGLSNPLVMAQYARRLPGSWGRAWSAEAGLQVELPFGDQEHGLAGDHVMLLPWVGLRRDWDAWYVTGMLGYSHALEAHAHATDTAGASARLAKTLHEGHEHEGVTSPVLVNPHADREAQYRAAAGWTRGRGTAEVFALGQADVTANGPTSYVRAGASYAWSLGRFTALNVIADAPVTSARRNELEIGVGVKTGW